MEAVEEMGIVIVGGGICGLATALALHRKGISSVILERSESLRATGGAIGIQANGWRALDQLGIGSKLRQAAIRIQRARTIWVDTGRQQELTLSDELRTIERGVLIEMLAADLPSGTIRCGSQVVSIKLDAQNSCPILHMHDGGLIKAQVVIGCDGGHSVVADFLELKPLKLIPATVVRGLTNHPGGHGLPPEGMRLLKGPIMLGTAPLTDSLIYWFVTLKGYAKESNVPKDPEVIRSIALESTKDFPAETIEMIRDSDPDSLTFTHLRYRAPWEILFGSFRRGSVTVAGDAMHIMGPFLAQGGSAGIEDAVVLARCLATKLHEISLKRDGRKKVEEALDAYVKERSERNK